MRKRNYENLINHLENILNVSCKMSDYFELNTKVKKIYTLMSEDNKSTIKKSVIKKILK